LLEFFLHGHQRLTPGHVIRERFQVFAYGFKALVEVFTDPTDRGTGI
jgi:hypothetical protein